MEEDTMLQARFPADTWQCLEWQLSNSPNLIKFAVSVRAGSAQFSELLHF